MINKNQNSLNCSVINNVDNYTLDILTSDLISFINLEEIYLFIDIKSKSDKTFIKKGFKRIDKCRLQYNIEQNKLLSVLISKHDRWVPFNFYIQCISL